MTVIEKPLLAAAAEVHLLANTPKYLYKHLKRLEAVQALADSTTTTALGQRCLEISQRPDRTREDDLAFYLYLISLACKPAKEAGPYLTQLRAAPVRWAEALCRIMEANRKAITNVDLFVQPQVSLAPESERSDTSRTNVRLSLDRPHSP